MNFRHGLIILIAVFALITAIGCSNGGIDPAAPADVAGTAQAYSGNRTVWGMWSFSFDPSAMVVSVEPQREMQAHFNITNTIQPPSCTDCLDIKVNSYDPSDGVVDLDITLRNTYGITGHDVRGIVYTDDLNTELVNPDAWTDLFDLPGGEPLNPFKVYAVDAGNRAFIPGAEYTGNFLVRLPGEPAEHAVIFSVDASWPGNCKEPYEIEVVNLEPLYDEPGSSGAVVLNVRDWQNDVTSVSVEAPDLTGKEFVSMVHAGNDTWQMDLGNDAGAPAGQYRVRVIAVSGYGENALEVHDYITITVKERTSWAATFGADSGDDKAYRIALDGEGNIYTTGYFGSNYNPTVDFDPGDGVLNCTSHGCEDVYISKFTSTGNFLWARAFGGPGGDRGQDVAVDDSGNVYVTGWFKGMVDFDPGAGTEVRTSVGDCDVFVSKYDSNGEFISCFTFGGSSWDYGCAVGIDSAGDLLVSGAFRKTVDFDPSAGVNQKTSNGGEDAFLAKYTSTGSLLWVSTWGGDSESLPDVGRALALDSNDRIYVTGEMEDSDDMVAYLNCHTSFGVATWCVDWRAVVSCEPGRGVAVDSADNIYVVGWFENQVDFNPGAGNCNRTSKGGRDAFINVFNPSGDHQWVKVWGSNGSDEAFDIAFTPSGEMFVCGYFESGASLSDLGGGTLNSNGGRDAFLLNVSHDGALNWSSTWGGDGSDEAFGVDVNSEGKPLIAGYFQGTADFDPGSGENVHASNGFFDAFLCMFPADGVF